MKVAIVTCGLLDCMLPLAKHLGKAVHLDLYIVVHGQKFNESVGNFSLHELPLGLIDQQSTEKVLGQKLSHYLKTNAQVRVRFFKYPNLKVLSRKNFLLHRQMAQHIKRERYDVVHFNGYRGSQMFTYGWLSNIPKVWTIHDPVLHSGEDKWQTRLAYRTFRFLKAHFILHNQQQLPGFLHLYSIAPERCHFIPFGPYEVFRLFENGHAIQEEAHTILFFGRILPYKGLEYLIEAAKEVKKNVPDLKVIIAGKPNYALDTAAIQEDSTFEYINRYVPNHELVQFIKQASCVICPYTDATQSGVVMTAYAFQKPVIATAVGGIPEVIEDGVNGKLVPPRNGKALAESISAYLSNRQMQQQMQKNIDMMQTSGAFSWDHIAQRTIEVYKQAVSDQY